MKIPTFTFVASASPSAPKSLTLADVPQEVRDACEESYEALKTNPNGRLRAEFDSKQELLQFCTLAATYCENRPAGRIRFRKSPTRNLPDNAMEFRISDPLTASDEATADIREKTAAANAPAKAAKAPAQRKTSAK